MTKISKRSAASRKSWRTRKKMKAARSEWIEPEGVSFEWLESLELPQQPPAPSQRLLPPNPFLEIGR